MKWKFVLAVFGALLFAALLIVSNRTLQPSHRLGAISGVRPPIINPNWNRNWCIDGQNSTGCASDENNGTTCTCGGLGVGPLSTWAELIARYGTFEPVISANVVITFQSSQQVNDFVVFRPVLQVIAPTDASSVTGPTVQLVGNLTTASSGNSITLISAKNRTTNTRFQVSGTAASQEQLIQNTTGGKNSYSWVFRLSQLGQPLVPTVINSGGQAPTLGAEVDTWATSDTVSDLTLPSTYIVDVHPTSACLQGFCRVEIYHVQVVENRPASVNPGDDQTIIGTNVDLIESAFQRAVWYDAVSDGYNTQGIIINCAMDGGFLGGQHAVTVTPGGVSNTVIQANAGYIQVTGPLAGVGQNSFAGVWLDDDIIVRSPTTNIYFQNYNFLGLVEFESKVVLQNGVLDVKSRANSSNIVWGALGVLDAGLGKIVYASGAGAAATTFTIPTLQISGQTVACLGVPSVATPTLTCNKTINTTNLDADLGTTSGCYWVEGSGSYCNFGP